MRPNFPRRSSEIGQDAQERLAAARPMSGADLKQRPRRAGRARQLAAALFPVLAVLPGLGWFWGFTVDDAWIVSRVVDRALSGGAFEFHPGRPTDAVTPLGFAQLLWLVGRALGVDGFGAARGLGLLATLGSAGVAAEVVRRGSAGQGARPALLLALGLGNSAPLLAWAGAGLETPLVALLATLGAALFDEGVRRRAEGADGAARRGIGVLLKGGAWLTGAAAALRPELLPWALASGAVALAACRAAPGATRARQLADGAALLGQVLAPSLLVALVRLRLYGTPLPLAFLAKAPDAGHGLRYALGAAFLSGSLWPLWTTPTLWRTRPGRPAWAVPALVHVGALVFAGGDWMPLFRLVVPILPFSLAVAAREVAPRSARTVGFGLLVLSGALLSVGLGPSARRTLAARERLVAAALPALREARVVAAVDVGWLGRAHPGAIVDLSGVTDPRLAALPGGHTTRRVAPALLGARGVDTWVLRVHGRGAELGAPVGALQPVYGVDRALARQAEGYLVTAVLPLEGKEEKYAVARYREP